MIQETSQRRETTGLKTVTFVDARKILGAKKVITPAKSKAVWGKDFAHSPIIRFEEETLLKARNENNSGLSDWRLFTSTSMSHWDMYQKSLRRRRKLGISYDTAEFGWWLKIVSYDKKIKENPIEPAVVRKADQAVYLFNFKPSFAGKGQTCLKLDEKIALLDRYESADDIIYSQAIQTFFLLYGEKIGRDIFHCSQTSCKCGNRIVVAPWYGGGQYHNLFSVPLCTEKNRMGVVLSRKYDF
jgi:hypothetical protein